MSKRNGEHFVDTKLPIKLAKLGASCESDHHKVGVATIEEQSPRAINDDATNFVQFENVLDSRLKNENERAKFIRELKKAIEQLKDTKKKVFWLILPHHSPIDVSGSVDEDATVVAARTVAAHGLPLSYVERIGKWFRAHVDADEELTAGQLHATRPMFSLFRGLWRSERSFDVNVFRSVAGRQAYEYRRQSIESKALSDKYIAVWIEAIFAILQRTGSLHHLELSEQLPPTKLGSILRYCGLSLRSVVFHNSSPARTFSCSTLPKCVRLNSLAKIRKMDFTRYSLFTAQLESIPSTVEVLLNFRPPSDTDLESFIRKHPNLTQLEICVSVRLPFAIIAECCPLLRKLSLNAVSYSTNDVRRLVGLTELRLTNGWLTHEFADADDVIDICANNPCLRALSIRFSLSSREMAQRACEALGALDGLEEFEALYDGGSCAIDDDCTRRLVSAGSLRSIKLMGPLRQLTDRSLDHIGAHCSKLRWLQIETRAPMTAGAFRRLIDCIVAAPEWRADRDHLKIKATISGVDMCETTALAAMTRDDSGRLAAIGVDVQALVY